MGIGFERTQWQPKRRRAARVGRPRPTDFDVGFPPLIRTFMVRFRSGGWFQNVGGPLLARLDRLDEAESCWREVLDQRRRVVGDFHPHTINTIASLGELLQRRSRWAEAESLLREALDKRLRVFGESHAVTIESGRALAELLNSQGRAVEADALPRGGDDR